VIIQNPDLTLDEVLTRISPRNFLQKSTERITRRITRLTREGEGIPFTKAVALLACTHNEDCQPNEDTKNLQTT
jgi:hypothetical protein